MIVICPKKDLQKRGCKRCPHATPHEEGKVFSPCTMGRCSEYGKIEPCEPVNPLGVP
jgi:hypothetical protein